jgi:hypothetical protein
MKWVVNGRWCSIMCRRGKWRGWPLVSSQGEPGALTVPNSGQSLEPSIFRQVCFLYPSANLSVSGARTTKLM